MYYLNLYNIATALQPSPGKKAWTSTVLTSCTRLCITKLTMCTGTPMPEMSPGLPLYPCRASHYDRALLKPLLFFLPKCQHYQSLSACPLPGQLHLNLNSHMIDQMKPQSHYYSENYRLYRGFFSNSQWGSLLTGNHVLVAYSIA